MTARGSTTDRMPQFRRRRPRDFVTIPADTPFGWDLGVVL